MNYELINKNDKICILFNSTIMDNEINISDIISLCFEHNCHEVILGDGTITDNFINLRTGIAGEVIQKLINYQIKAAIVIDSERILNDRFNELILEYNKGSSIRFYKSTIEASNWLLK